MGKKTKKLYKKLSLIIFGIVLQSVFSYSYGYYSALKEEKQFQRNTRIILIDKKLNEFYIPLKIKLDQSKRLFITYKKKYANSDVFSQIESGDTSKNTLRWQRYMLSVFQPIHIQLGTILSQKRYLLDKNVKIDEQLNLLEQHIAYYNVIFMQWEYKDVTENFAPTHFPKDLSSLISVEIQRLKIEKIKLLAE